MRTQRREEAHSTKGTAWMEDLVKEFMLQDHILSTGPEVQTFQRSYKPALLGCEASPPDVIAK